MSVRVVKVGGRALGDPAWLERFAAETKAAAGRLVVVHGGGPEVDTLSQRLGVPVERVAGLRVTSIEALAVTTMMLSGVLNKRLVSTLLDAGVDAVGLSGEDGGLLLAEPSQNGALGRVGDVVRVRMALLEQLMEAGIVPVVSPVSRSTAGGALNVNADDAAAAVATALGAGELLFLTDVDGVHDGQGVRRELGVREAQVLLDSGVARDGMGVKLAAALRALDDGVAAVRIGGLETLVRADAGTRVVHTMEVVG